MTNIPHKKTAAPHHAGQTRDAAKKKKLFEKKKKKMRRIHNMDVSKQLFKRILHVYDNIEDNQSKCCNISYDDSRIYWRHEKCTQHSVGRIKRPLKIFLHSTWFRVSICFYTSHPMGQNVGICINNM